MRPRNVVSVLFCAFLAMSAWSQNPTTGSIEARFSGPPPLGMPAITGAPYSGEELNERVQTLADGTHINQKMIARKVYRDSQGRTRSERPVFMGATGAPTGPTIVEITDPAAGFQYLLDAGSKVAHRFTLPPPPTPGQRQTMPGQIMQAAPLPPPPPGVAGVAVAGGAVRSGSFSATLPAPAGQLGNGLRPEFQTESLGTQTIDGVTCQGTRRTTIFPIGMQGNDAPIRVVSETWMSPELRITVLSKTSDPRSGDSTFSITNLSRTEPDTLLFQVPPDYSIVDETGPVTIKFSK